LNADALGGAIGGGGGSWVLRHIIATGNQAVGGNGTTFAGGGFGGAIHVETANSFSMTDSYLSANLAQGGNASNSKSKKGETRDRNCGRLDGKNSIAGKNL